MGIPCVTTHITGIPEPEETARGRLFASPLCGYTIQPAEINHVSIDQTQCRKCGGILTRGDPSAARHPGPNPERLACARSATVAKLVPWKSPAFGITLHIFHGLLILLASPTGFEPVLSP